MITSIKLKTNGERATWGCKSRRMILVHSNLRMVATHSIKSRRNWGRNNIILIQVSISRIKILFRATLREPYSMKRSTPDPRMDHLISPRNNSRSRSPPLRRSLMLSSWSMDSRVHHMTWGWLRTICRSCTLSRYICAPDPMRNKLMDTSRIWVGTSPLRSNNSSPSGAKEAVLGMIYCAHPIDYPS